VAQQPSYCKDGNYKDGSGLCCRPDCYQCNGIECSTRWYECSHRCSPCSPPCSPPCSHPCSPPC